MTFRQLAPADSALHPRAHARMLAAQLFSRLPRLLRVHLPESRDHVCGHHGFQQPAKGSMYGRTMAQHKRHHYVPRCYLRPFSLSSCGRAINLHNISTGRAIRNAPVKGQCARDYFYGDATDLRLEKTLQSIEGAYSHTIRKLLDNTNSIDQEDIALLREFGFLQFLRTDIAIKRMRTLVEDFQSVAYERYPDARPSIARNDRSFMLGANAPICYASHVHNRPEGHYNHKSKQG